MNDEIVSMEEVMELIRKLEPVQLGILHTALTNHIIVDPKLKLEIAAARSTWMYDTDAQKIS